MRRLPVLAAICVLVIPTTAAPPAAVGDEANFAAAVRDLLTSGWGKSFRSLKPAGDAYEQARSASPADPRAAYAFGIAHLKHHRYREAGKLFDQALALAPGHRPSLRARVWVLLISKDYDAGLVQMERMAAALPGADGETAADDRQLARYLGQLFGYLEGPAADSVQPDAVARRRQLLAGRLPESLARELETGRMAVDRQFTELWLEREQTRDDAKANETQAKQEAAERLKREQQAVQGQKQTLNERSAATREELDTELSDIDKQLAPLARELDRLALRAEPLRRRMIDLDREISRILALAEQTDDPVQRQRLRIDADRLSVVYGRTQREYRILDAQAARVRTQQGALLNRRRAAIARYDAEQKRLGREASGLRRNEQRIAREEKRVRQPALGNTGGVRSLSAQATALKTYIPFPLERARQQVLDSLKQE